MICSKCDAEIKDDVFEYGGRKLCEDCYLDVVAAPRTCDPWAVYTAKRTMEQGRVLTPLQEKILNTIKQKGPLSLEEVCSALSITEDDFKTNFATLRHMELLKGSKVGDRVIYKLFNA